MSYNTVYIEHIILRNNITQKKSKNVDMMESGVVDGFKKCMIFPQEMNHESCFHIIMYAMYTVT